MPGDGSKSGGSQTSYTSQPGINTVLGTAMKLFQGGQAWAPDTTSHVTPFSTQTNAGLTGLQKLAGSTSVKNMFTDNFNRINDAYKGLGDNGLTSLQDQQVGRLQDIAGGNGMNAEQQANYNALDPTANGLNAEQQGAFNLLNPIAQGSMMQGNPYLDEVINRTSQDIGNSSNMMASAAGRYGSGAHQGVLNDAIGDMSAKLRYQNYGDEANRRDAAINSLFGMGSTGAGQRSTALNQRFGMGTQGAAQKADAVGSLYNAGQQGLQNIQGGTNAISGAYDARQGLNRDMLGVGQMREGKNQQVIDDNARVLQERKNALTSPVNWLSNLAGAWQGGQQVSNSQVPTQSPLSKILGGGLAGYDMFGGPWGAGLGGLYGAVS